MDEIMAEFLSEAEEMLRIFQLAIDDLGMSQKNTEEKLHRAYRAIHTIHGAAGFLALEELQQLSRHAESLIWKIEEAGRRPTLEEFKLLSRLKDAFQRSIRTLQLSGREGKEPELLAELSAIHKATRRSGGADNE